MSLEYLLTTGALVIGFLVILKLLMDALAGSMYMTRCCGT